MGSVTISIHEERLQISEPGRKQNESIRNRLILSRQYMSALAHNLE